MMPRTSSPSSNGPQTSSPGSPDMPCRSARTFRPPMEISPMWKNLISGTGPPFSFSSSCGAFGPWIW